MARLSASIGLLVALFVLPLYPKIALVSVSGTYIPLRLDDLIIAAAAAVWIVALAVSRRLPAAPRELTAAVTLWLGVTFIALLVGAFVLDSIGIVEGAAFWAKPIEYVLLGLMTYDLVRNGWLPIRYVIATVLASAAIVVAYGVAEHYGLVPHLPGEAVPPGGTTSTLGDFHELASYLGLIVVLVVCIFRDATSRGVRLALVALGGGAIFVLFATGTRSEYIALFVVLLGLAVWRPMRAPAALAAVVMPLLFISPVVGYLLAMPGPVVHPGPQASPGAVAPVAVIPPGDPFYNTTVRFADQSLVYSLGERFLHKWPAMVQQTMRSLIIGLGPSAATEAADGYYLRVFVESGILGVLVFVGLVFTVARSSLRAARRATGLAKSLAVAALAATVFISLVGVLIDTWVASRVMELFWPLIGLSLAAVALQREVSNTTDATVARQPVSAASSV